MTDQTVDEAAQNASSDGDKTLEKRKSPLQNQRVRKVLLIAAIIVAAALAFWAFRYFTHGRYIESTNDATIQADAIIVAPKVSGYVLAVEVGNNQQVRAGDPLLRIDPGDYRAKVAQFQAQQGVALAGAEFAAAQIREQEAVVNQALADLALAQSAARHATGEAERYRPLAESGAESQEKYASLLDQQRQANARVQAASANLAQAQRHVGTLRTQIDQARAQGNVAKAQMDAAATDLSGTVMRAAVDGRVGDKTVQVGQFVQPGTRLMSLVPLDKFYVTANFKETQVSRMRVGQPVTVLVDALPGVPIKGIVDSFAPGTGARFSLIPPENATGNFTKIVQRIPVRISLSLAPETAKRLLPGMSVTAEVDTNAAKDANDELAREQEKANAKAAR